MLHSPRGIDNNTQSLRFQTINTDQCSRTFVSRKYIFELLRKKQTKGVNVQKIDFFYKESTRRRDNPAYVQSLSTSAKQTRLHSAQTYELTIRRWTGYPD